MSLPDWLYKAECPVCMHVDGARSLHLDTCTYTYVYLDSLHVRSHQLFPLSSRLLCSLILIRGGVTRIYSRAIMLHYKLLHFALLRFAAFVCYLSEFRRRLQLQLRLQLRLRRSTKQRLFCSALLCFALPRFASASPHFCPLCHALLQAPL